MSAYADERADSASRTGAELLELHEDAAEELGLLLVRSLTYDECSVPWVQQRVFHDPAVQPRYTLGLRKEGRLVAAVAGMVHERAREGHVWRVGHIKVLATDPSARRHGHAMRLLDELEERFVADGVDEVTTQGAPLYFWPGIDVRYSPALCLFEQRGYTSAGAFFNLGVDLDGRDFSTERAEEVLAAEGVVVRRIVPGDRAALDAYLSARWGRAWHDETMTSFDHDPLTCHIALKEEHIVAFAATDLARPGWFGPTGTNEELRGRGIGRILLWRCLTDWQRAGRKYGEISWIGPLYFYVTSCDARVSRVFQPLTKRLTQDAQSSRG